MVNKRYDVNTGTWIDLAPMPCEAVMSCAVARNRNTIILTGGHNIKESGIYGSHKEHYLTKSFIYNIPTNKWKLVSGIPKPVRWPAVAAHNNIVYVAGGYFYKPMCQPQPTRRFKSYEMWAYDPGADVWLAKLDIPQEFDLIGPEMHTIDDKLLICSSCYCAADLEVGVFDVAQKNWTKITFPSCGGDVRHSFIYDSKVHIVATQGDTDGDSVITYTIDSQGRIVTSTQILPRFRSRVVCALVYAN